MRPFTHCTSNRRRTTSLRWQPWSQRSFSIPGSAPTDVKEDLAKYISVVFWHEKNLIAPVAGDVRIEEVSCSMQPHGRQGSRQYVCGPSTKVEPLNLVPIRYVHLRRLSLMNASGFRCNLKSVVGHSSLQHEAALRPSCRSRPPLNQQNNGALRCISLDHILEEFI